MDRAPDPEERTPGLHAVLACGLVPMVMLPVSWWVALRSRDRSVFTITTLDTVLAIALGLALLIAGAPAAPDTAAPPTLGVELDPGYEDAGARVARVTASSAADEAGLCRDDVIVAIDGVAVASWEDLSGAVAEGVSGQTRMLTVHRGAQVLELPVTPRITLASTDVFEPSGGSCSENWLGNAIGALWPVAIAVVTMFGFWASARGPRGTRGRGRWIWGLMPLGAAPLAGIAVAWLTCERAGGWSVGAALVGTIAQGLVLFALGAIILRTLGGELHAVVTPRLDAIRAAKLAVFYIAAAMTRAAVALFVLFTLVPSLRPVDAAVGELLAGSSSPLGRALVLVAAVVIAPLAEEVVFRGIILPGLAQRIRPGAALIVSSALFGMFHVPSHGVGALLPALLGLVFGWARLRTGNIAAPVLLHFANNLLVTLLAWTV